MGILYMIAEHGDLASEQVKDSAACAARQIEDARDLLGELWDVTTERADDGETAAAAGSD